MSNGRAVWAGPAQPAIVARMRRRVAEFAADAGVTGDRLEDVRACVSEAVTNAVVHGYHDGRTVGTVETRAELADGGLLVIVADDGMGFHPRSDSPGVGLGMSTIAALTATMSIAPGSHGGTELRMLFPLDA
jgi:anti-sigma regulatory factor (Ser/Thr protein kinase)